MAYKDVTPPAGGKISIKAGKLTVPDNPVIPFIRGDGTGPDIWAASERVFDAAVKKAYGGERKIAWFEVFAGEASKNKFDNWLPDDTVEAFKEYLVGIKGPLTTPVGGGIRSLNVALRQMLDLYVCLRPVQWFTGVPSPVKHPEKVNMVIFRENTEDIYAGIDYQAGSVEAKKILELLQKELPSAFKKIRFGAEDIDSVGIGLKPVSKPGTERLVRAALEYAIANQRQSLTIVHKGNIMKFTEGAFRDWAYDLAKREFGAVEMDGGPWCKIPEGKPGAGIVIKDAIADITLQQVLTRPTDFDVIATLNLNGDYLSDALAAQVGGIGIAPFIGQLQALADSGKETNVDLFYSTSAPDSGFIERIRRLAEQASVRLHVLVASQDGRLTPERLRQLAPHWQDCDIWFCGPTGFARDLRKDLQQHGLAPEDFHQELFDMR